MASISGAPGVSLGSSIKQSIINLSRDAFNELQYSEEKTQFDKIVVGAAVFRKTANGPSILLLKRAPNEPYFPNVFELPSGKVDPEDQSIKHALIREVKEETGLDIVVIESELKDMKYVTEKTVVNQIGQKSLVSRSAIQLNYLVYVSAGDPKLNEQEHSESIWATKEELHVLEITGKMREVIEEAFTAFVAGQD